MRNNLYQTIALEAVYQQQAQRTDGGYSMNRAKFGLFVSPLVRCVSVERIMRAFNRVKEDMDVTRR